MMSKRIFLLSITLAILVTAAGCAGMGSESPSDVVKAVYMAANDGNTGEVERRLSAPDSATVEIIGILASQGKQQRWKPSVKKGSIESIEILNEQKTTYRATVRFRLHFKDGKKKEMQVPLIKEGGVWKIER
jgi:hypothetical protein